MRGNLACKCFNTLIMKGGMQKRKELWLLPFTLLSKNLIYADSAVISNTPRCIINTPKWKAFLALNFCMSLLLWVLTVSWVMYNSFAVSSVVIPFDKQWRTSFSLRDMVNVLCIAN